MNEGQSRNGPVQEPAEIPPTIHTDNPDVLPEKSWHSTFNAFRIVNYRWFFAALCGNFASMNMQMFIRGWLVFEITGSYEKLGWMTAAGGIVGLFAAPIGGVVADRVRQKKHVLQVSGCANALVTFGVLRSSTLSGPSF